MNYICTDRGGEGCPCHLMEAGRCYTCTMTARGYCSCEEKAGWQGVCPYTEYLQQGSTIREGPRDRLSAFPVLRKTSCAPGLHVIRTAVPAGLAEQCMAGGTYMMVQALGWRTPISLLGAGLQETGLDGRGTDGMGTGRSGGWLEFLIKTAGPKTRELIRLAETEGVWQMAGPYGNGLPGMEQLKKLPRLTIARGVAAAPLIHLLSGTEPTGDCILYIDDEGLPESFLADYLNGWVRHEVRLGEETVEKKLQQQIRQETESGRPVLLLVSPYYADLLCRGLSIEQQALVVRPNPANLCCGMGLCGACSHTDRDGVTVKLCKCSQAVIK